MDQTTLRSLLALKMVYKVGDITIKNLIAYCGSPQAVFKEKQQHLESIPGIGKKIAQNIASFDQQNMDIVDQEIEFMEQHDIQPVYYLEQNYPERMKDLDDAPVLLMTKGNLDLNHFRMLGIVGTRRATEYGRYVCEKIVEGLKSYNVAIVSGLAFGIDQAAHSAALKNEMPTLGVLAHGLDRIYPDQHRSMAKKMLDKGGLVTEYTSGSQPDASNFPERNRIIAGLIDGVIVVESAEKGGALITADIAYSYNREVLAVPGRVNDDRSKGPNRIIKNKKGYLVENGEDVAFHHGWEPVAGETQDKISNRGNMRELATEEELPVLQLLEGGKQMHLNAMSSQLNFEVSTLSVLLFNMELKGLIKTLPGNHYQGMV